MPLAVDGFGRTSAWMSAFALSASACSVNDDLADAGVDDARLLDAVLDLAGLGLAHGVADVERDGADLGVRHEAARTEDATELTDRAHHVGRRDHAIEVHEAFVDLRDQVVAAGEVGAGLAGLALFLALGEHEDAHGLSGPVRQHDRAADHLIGVLGIHAQTDREVDRLVELGELRLLHERARLLDACTCACDRRWRRRFARFFGIFGIVLLVRLLRLSASHRCARMTVAGRWCFAVVWITCVDVGFSRRLDAHRARGARDGAASRPRCRSRSCPASSAVASSRTCFVGDLADLVLVRLLRARARLLRRRRARRPS